MNEMFKDPIALVIMVIVFGAFAHALFYQWKVRRNGHETEAVIIYIEEKSHSGSDGIEYYYDFHVTYQDHEGTFREGVIANPIFSKVEEGDTVIIRYVDNKPQSPVYIRKA